MSVHACVTNDVCVCRLNLILQGCVGDEGNTATFSVAIMSVMNTI